MSDQSIAAASKRGKGDRVRARILLPFTLVILAVITALVVAAYMFEGREHERRLQESVAATERLFRQGVATDAAMMQAALIAIAGDDKIRSAFMDGDRQALMALVQPLFQSLRRNNHITHFYFTRPDRVNFLRVHEPNQYGDLIDRVTTRRAVENRQFVSGLELGRFGTLTLRVVLPWYVNDRLIGLLELGEEVGHITDGVHDILGADLLVLVYDRFIDPRGWEEGRRMLAHQSDWPRIGSLFVVGRAMERIPRLLGDFLASGDQTHRTVLRMREGGRDLYAAMLPLTDIGGQHVGELAVVRDVTSSQASFRTVMTSTALLSLAAGGIVFAVFYVILGKVERDYRRQREMELQLSRVNTEHQKAVQLEKLSAMGMMVGEIAHQLNNPLVGVVNMAQLAEREIHDPHRSGELLEAIARAGKDCQAFVRRMLEFTKISHFECKPTDMKQLLGETLALFRQSAGKQVQLKIELPQAAPLLDVDPILISHAIFNLLSNAAQVSPPGGMILVRLFPRCLEKGGLPGWCLTVRDQGPGLSDEVLGMLYTPFFTTRAEGTGLGLTVVQHVVILHEGEISATNAEGGGALFALWLPDTRDDAQ